MANFLSSNMLDLGVKKALMTSEVALRNLVLQLVVADTMRGDLNKSINKTKGYLEFTTIVVLSYIIQSLQGMLLILGSQTHTI